MTKKNMVKTIIEEMELVHAICTAADKDDPELNRYMHEYLTLFRLAIILGIV